jgi:hypothetical protein
MWAGVFSTGCCKSLVTGLRSGLSSQPALNLLKTQFLREKPAENDLFLLDLFMKVWANM